MYPGLGLTPGNREPDDRFGPGSLTLLDLPAAVRAAGIGDLDLCHFHFPRTDAAYLREFRDRLAAADVRLLTLLVDEGDISAADPAVRERDLARIREWVDIAALLGARYARVVAGEREAGNVRRGAEHDHFCSRGSSHLGTEQANRSRPGDDHQRSRCRRGELHHPVNAAGQGLGERSRDFRDVVRQPE